MCLLRRARWFEDRLRASEKGQALLQDSRAAEDTAWQVGGRCVWGGGREGG